MTMDSIDIRYKAYYTGRNLGGFVFVKKISSYELGYKLERKKVI